MPKVSVIIPVYNVAEYIERCLLTLFGQTLRDMEYIFVDDGSLDDSVAKIGEVVERFPDFRKTQVKILRHNRNRGVAAARATGIQAATGDYVIHCDPDDYVETDMYEKMYQKAIADHADIVACHYFEEWPHHTKTIRRNYAQTPQDCLENIYRRNCHCSRLWDKLIRRSLIEQYDIIPCEGCDYAEDLDCIVRVLYHASSISVVALPLYHYCRREDSITRSLKDRKVWDMRKRVMDRICAFLNREPRYRTACHQMQFYAKMECRAAFDGDEYQWFHTYRGSHGAILRYNDMPLKVRIMWWIVLQHYAIFRMAKKWFPTFR